MTQPNNSPNAMPMTESKPASWPRPTLVALPPLRDLTLQSGIAGNVGTSSLMSF